VGGLRVDGTGAVTVSSDACAAGDRVSTLRRVVTQPQYQGRESPVNERCRHRFVMNLRRSSRLAWRTLDTAMRVANRSACCRGGCRRWHDLERLRGQRRRRLRARLVLRRARAARWEHGPRCGRGRHRRGQGLRGPRSPRAQRRRPWRWRQRQRMWHGVRPLPADHHRRAPVAQRIEQRPPEPCAQVRVLPGAHLRFGPLTSAKMLVRASSVLTARTRR